MNPIPPAADQPEDRAGSAPLSLGLAGAILAFGVCNITITLLRGAKPEWMAAAWLFVFFGWGLLCLRSLRTAYLLMLLTLPIFGARPGDLVTSVQDTIILVTAAASLWRFPIALWKRPVLWPGWLLAAVGLVSLLAHTSLCFHPLWPVHQDNYTRNLFFMFSKDWDRTIGVSEWWNLVLMLILARGAWHLLRCRLLRLRTAAAALTMGLILALCAGYADYFSLAFHQRWDAYHLRTYDAIEDVAPHWPMPAWLRSPVGGNVTMKSFFRNRSWFSLYLLAATPVAVCWFASHRSRVLRRAWVPMLIACLLAAVLTGAKGCLYSAGIALLVLALMFVVGRWRFRETLASPWLVWAVLLLLASSLLVPWLLCVLPLQSAWLDTTFRDTAWSKAVILLKERPFLGVGYESFGLAARELPSEDSQTFITAHNFLLQILTCTGPLGLLAVLLLFRTPVRLLLYRLALLPGPRRPSLLRAGLAFMFLMVILGGQPQHWFYNHSNALLWWIGLAMLEATGKEQLAIASPTTPEGTCSRSACAAG